MDYLEFFKITDGLTDYSIVCLTSPNYVYNTICATEGLTNSRNTTAGKVDTYDRENRVSQRNFNCLKRD